MQEKNLIGNIYYTECDHTEFNKYGLAMVTRKGKQGWAIDLEALTPNDLRVLADFLESRGEKK